MKNIHWLTPARITGYSILLMAVLAILAMGLFFQYAFSLGKGELQNFLIHNQRLFVFGLTCWLGIWLTDILASLGIILLYRHSSKALAYITGLIRLLYSVILGWAIYQLLPLLNPLLLSGEQLFQALHAFEKIWSFGLILFGLHLIGLGLLTRRLKRAYVLLPICLITGGIGYTGINSGILFVPNFQSTVPVLESIFILPMMAGELGFALLLVWKPTILISTFTDTLPHPTERFGSHT